MGPKCNHECTYKREAKRDLTTETEGNVMTEERCYAASFEDGKEGQWPMNARTTALGV